MEVENYPQWKETNYCRRDPFCTSMIMGGRVEPMDVFFHKQHAWASSDSWCVPPLPQGNPGPVSLDWPYYTMTDTQLIPAWIPLKLACSFILNEFHLCQYVPSPGTHGTTTQRNITVSINCRLGSCIVSIPGYNRSSDLWAPLRVHTCGQAKRKQSGLARMTSHHQQQHLSSILFGLIVTCPSSSSSSSSSSSWSWSAHCHNILKQ